MINAQLDQYPLAIKVLLATYTVTPLNAHHQLGVIIQLTHALFSQKLIHLQLALQYLNYSV